MQRRYGSRKKRSKVSTRSNHRGFYGIDCGLLISIDCSLITVTKMNAIF